MPSARTNTGDKGVDGGDITGVITMTSAGHRELGEVTDTAQALDIADGRRVALCRQVWVHGGSEGFSWVKLSTGWVIGRHDAGRAARGDLNSACGSGDWDSSDENDSLATCLS
jgi:hypothetical protein